MAGINVDGDERILSYSVQENATPLNPGDTGAALGQVVYSGYETLDPKLEKMQLLVDPEKPWINPATVKDVSIMDGVVSITSDNAFSVLNHWFSVEPFSGSLRGYIAYLTALCGVVPPMAVDPSVADRSVVANGYEGNVWEGLKEFLSANYLEAVYDTARIWIQAPHRVNHELRYPTTISKNRSSQSTAEWLSCTYRDLVYPGVVLNLELYPDHDDYSAGILSVDANETVELEITIDGSVSEVNQPVCLDYVPANTDYTGTMGVYCVSGGDGKPIEANRWKAGGGSLKVYTTDDPSVLRVVLTGSKVEEYSPYKIAATAGSSDYYNSLHITGHGLRWRERTVEMHTGAPRSATERETALEIDNRHIFTRDQAYNAMLHAAPTLCGGFTEVSGTAAPSGPSVGDRVAYDGAIYRTNSVMESPNNTQFSLGIDSTIADFNVAHPNMTVAEFNKLFAGQRILEFNERHL